MNNIRRKDECNVKLYGDEAILSLSLKVWMKRLPLKRVLRRNDRLLLGQKLERECGGERGDTDEESEENEGIFVFLCEREREMFQ